MSLVRPKEVPLGDGNPFSWQKAMISRCTLGGAGNQSLPCVKGGGVRKDDGGIVPGIDLICKAGDYSL